MCRAYYSRGWCFVFKVLIVVSGVLSAQAQSGKLVGYWNNTTFGSFGPVILYVDISLTEISLRLETDGPQDGIPPFELTSPLRSTGGSAKIAGHPTLGDVYGSVTLMGNVNVRLVDVPHEIIQAGSATGKFDFEKLTLTLDYRIRFRTDTPEDQLVEGVDDSLGNVSASTAVEPRFEYIYPRPMGGDHFYATGPSGSFARIGADGLLTEFHERPFEWPFYDMARVADQILMFSRFGRVLTSADFANSFREHRIFSGFTSPSPRISVNLPDGRLLLFTDGPPAVALTSDGVTWESITPRLTPEGGVTAPWVRSAAINNAGLILTLSLRQGDSAVLTTTPENPQVFEVLGRDFFNPEVAIVAAQERFLRIGKSFQTSVDGRA